jgi:hypothetical protein
MKKRDYDTYISELKTLPLQAQLEVFHWIEYLFLEAIYENFPVLIHNFDVESTSSAKTKKELPDYEQLIIWLIELSEKEYEQSRGMIRFLKIKYSNSKSQQRFTNFLDESHQLSPELKAELDSRIADLEGNPNMGVSWKQVVKNLEDKVGRKFKISS